MNDNTKKYIVLSGWQAETVKSHDEALQEARKSSREDPDGVYKVLEVKEMYTVSMEVEVEDMRSTTSND